MDTNFYLKQIKEGKLKFQDLDAKVGWVNATQLRLAYVEKELKRKFNDIKIDNDTETKPKIENLIGTIKVPLGISSQIHIKGEFAKGMFFVPFATTEGALIASINRGFKTLNLAGGVSTVILKNEQTRSLLFKIKSINKIKPFIQWINQNKKNLKKKGEFGSQFLKIMDISVHVTGFSVWVLIKADTGDAMGMNMITIAGKQIADYIEENCGEHDAIFCSESGNLCSDKKPSFMNMFNGRGKKVVASASIPEKIVNNVLKTTSKKLVELHYMKNFLGSAKAGSITYNSHFANIISALYLATGQDIAHVVDGSLGFNTVRETSSGLEFSVTLSSVQVGTVGGGTNLPSQKQALQILDCFGTGNPPGTNSKKLAEIVAASVLAGEISLLASLTTKTLSEAHKKLGR